MDTKFWQDIWIGDLPLADRFSRLFSLESNKECLVANSIHWSDRCCNFLWYWLLRHSPREREVEEFDCLTLLLRDFCPSQNGTDTWCWGLNSQGQFSSRSLVALLDDRWANVDDTSTQWSRLIPHKVNMFVWRMRRNFLPSLVQLAMKGVDVASVMCPSCKALWRRLTMLFSSAHQSWLLGMR